jgi:hypothetical protein
MNITVTAYDRNGREIKDGDIIENKYGVRTVVEFNPKLRQYIARDEAPFPTKLSEDDIDEYFEVVGNVAETPNFKPRYEAEVFYEKRKAGLSQSFFAGVLKSMFS